MRSKGKGVASSTRQATSYPAEAANIYWSVFEQSGMCMAHVDLGLRVVKANRYFSQRFGPADTDVQGHGFDEFVEPSERTRLRRHFTRLAQGGTQRFSEHVTAVGAGGGTFTGELVGIGVRRNAGPVIGMMVLVRPDRTERDPHQSRGRDKLLSPVDARLLEGVAAGESTAQLAERLFLSRDGVEYHVTTLLRKLKVANRPALVSKCYSQGILVIGQWPPQVLPEYVK